MFAEKTENGKHKTTGKLEKKWELNGGVNGESSDEGPLAGSGRNHEICRRERK